MQGNERMVATSNPHASVVFPALLGAALAGGGPLSAAGAAEPISAQDAHSIGVTAYQSEALTGKWNPPPVTKAAAPTLLPAQ